MESSARITPSSQRNSGVDVVANGDQTKKRNARQREPVIGESASLELNPSASKSP
jgi:hypothetical protein